MAIIWLATLSATVQGKKLTDDEMEQVLIEYDQKVSEICNRNEIARWNVAMDVSNKSLVEEQVRERA